MRTLALKRNTLVDRRGALLSIVLCAANVYDVKKLAEALGAKLYGALENVEENLCLDPGFGKTLLILIK